MAIALFPGPLAPIDIPAAMGDAPPSDFEGLVAGALDDASGLDDRIGANLDTMAPGLDGPGDDDPAPDLADATAGHEAQASLPDPDFSGESAAADAGSAQLAAFAATLPADPDRANTLHIDLAGDVFEGVDVDWDTLTAGGGGGGGGTGGTDLRPWKAKLNQWCLDHFGRAAEPGELTDIDVLYQRNGRIDQALFDQLIRENYEPRL